MKKENPQAEFTRLWHQDEHLDQYYKIEDMMTARVFCSQNTVQRHERVLFEKSPTHWNVMERVTSFGISSTLKRYSKNRVVKNFICKNNKFYLIEGAKGVKQCGVHHLNQYHKDQLYKYHPSLKFLEDESIWLSLNIVFSKKLFTFKKALAHYYGCQYTDNLKMVHESHNNPFKLYIKEKKKYQKVFINLHKANVQLFDGGNGDIVRDTATMAITLCRKIDLSWSFKRLEAEHDEMSAIITNMAILADYKEYEIPKVYMELGEMIGGLIKDSKTLAMEGLLKRHCVATYGRKIEKGNCAIYKYKGYTLQVSENTYNTVEGMIGMEPQPDRHGCSVPIIEIFNPLQVIQFRGYKNQDPPEALMQEIVEKVNNFNQIKIKKYDKYREKHSQLARNEWHDNNGVHEIAGGIIENINFQHPVFLPF